jgi:hypothetical protein
LKHCLEVIPVLSSVVSKVESELFEGFAELLQDGCREVMLKNIGTIIAADASVGTKSSLQQLQTQLALSVKAGINGLLDVARARFCETVEEIHEVILNMFRLSHHLFPCKGDSIHN